MGFGVNGVNPFPPKPGWQTSAWFVAFAHDDYEGDSLHVIAVTESEFLVQINRADGRPESTVGKATEWLRSARGSVRIAAGISADDARMDFYATKYGLTR